MWFICSLISSLPGYLKETDDIHVAYRKSSLLNYAFVCSLLATSELAPTWSYHWILMRRSAEEDASQQVYRHCPRAGGLLSRLVLQNLQEFSTAVPAPPPQKNCTQYPYSPRIIVEGDHPDKRLHWSRSKSLPICTHAQFRLICVSCVKFLRMRAETERLPLQNNSDDWKYKISNILD